MTTATETLTLSAVDDREHELTGLTSAQTERITAPERKGSNALACLHHGCRNQAVAREIALPGHHLAFADEGGNEFLIELFPGLTHIGRSTTAEIRVEDIYVSRRQAIIAQRGDGARILDDGSTGGTFVNGRGVVAQNLNDGDVIVVGGVALRYLIVR